MSEPFFSPSARQDMQVILEHIALDKPRAAAQFIDRLEQECWFLAKNSGVGTLREDLLPNLRCWSVDKYVICFQPAAEDVEIVRVLHGACDIAAVFN